MESLLATAQQGPPPDQAHATSRKCSLLSYARNWLALASLRSLVGQGSSDTL